MASFFINRPIFAWVIAIIIMLAGAISVTILPVAQYPDVAPPQVSISAVYPGASAKTVEETVTQVIEQKMKGLDNLLYISSSSDSSGTATINFTFENGTDVDIAQVQVQNKLQLATAQLPEVVQKQGLTVTKTTSSYFLVLAVISENGSMTDVDIADYIGSYIADPLGLVQGVGDINQFGGLYAMRIWCDPTKFEQYGLNPSDVISAVQEQNTQVAGGQLGSAPSLPGQEINITVSASERLQKVEEFENILLRINPDGSTVRLKDVARIELNSENFIAVIKYDGKPASGLGISLASGSNALETGNRVKETVESLSAFFPDGLKVEYAYDTTPFVKLSILSVVRTLFEAIVLVFFIMYLFLQNFRATLIPTIAVPVVLLGAFGVLAALGYTINSLTMFAMVLAIGLLVDDAIVVVENVERIMRDEGLPPKEAAQKSMGQITGALVGVAMVISAVFVPMAFTGGSTGIIYRQFSVTIVSAMLLSLIIAIVLTPALCATILPQQTHEAQRGVFGRFNRWFQSLTNKYHSVVKHILNRQKRVLAAFAILTCCAGFGFAVLPTGFLPDEDQGMLLASILLPPGATFERSEEVMTKLSDYLLTQEKESVLSVMTAAGITFSGNGQNTGLAFIHLRDWDERKDDHMKAQQVARRANMYLAANIPEAQVFVFAPPPITDLGTATGFDFELIDRAGLGHEALTQARDKLLMLANQNPVLRNVRPNGLNDVEQYQLDVDVAKAGAFGLRKGDINNVISSYWGSVYINDFMDRGRSKKVYLQADTQFRMQASDFNLYHIRNANGEMVPFSAFMTVRSTYGSPRLERYNTLPSIEILGESAPGKSSGDAMLAMKNLMSELPEGLGYSWTGMSYQEEQAGSGALLLYTLSLVVVFLCLAALYESWSVPLAVLLVVPTGLMGAVLGVTLRGMENDVYFQIGLLTIIGLSAKNSILIVEFAKSLHEQGMDLLKATAEAAQIRLRPIIMTSMAFILGVMPLALSNDAGSGGQNAIGTTVAAGMLTATSFGLFMTPIFFVLITNLFSRKKQNKSQMPKHPKAAEGEKQHA